MGSGYCCRCACGMEYEIPRDQMGFFSGQDEKNQAVILSLECDCGQGVKFRRGSLKENTYPCKDKRPLAKFEAYWEPPK